MNYLWRRHLISLGTALACAWWGVRYKLHLPLRQNEVRERIYRALDHLSTRQIHDIMEDFHTRVMVPRYRPAGIAELRRYEEEGVHVALVSATFNQIAQAAMEYLGCDVALATVMERDAQGHFTGAVDGEVTEGPREGGAHRGLGRRCLWCGGLVFGLRLRRPLQRRAPAQRRRARVCREPRGATLKREAERRGWPILEWK